MIIEKILLPLQPFVIPINGLTQGSTQFSLHAGKEFFGSFEHSEILDADLDVEVEVKKSLRSIVVDCTVSGFVTVLCDRCFEELKMAVDTGFTLNVGSAADSYGEETSTDAETVPFPSDGGGLDIGQAVYDYVNTSLPLRRVHPEGECNPETLRYLNVD